MKKISIILSPPLSREVKMGMSGDLANQLAVALKLPTQIANYWLAYASLQHLSYGDFPSSMEKCFKTGYAERGWMLDAFEKCARLELHVEHSMKSHLGFELKFWPRGPRADKPLLKMMGNVSPDGELSCGGMSM